MKIRYLPLLAFALPSCTSHDAKNADLVAAPAAARFGRFKNQFILDLWR